MKNNRYHHYVRTSSAGEPTDPHSVALGLKGETFPFTALRDSSIGWPNPGYVFTVIGLDAEQLLTGVAWVNGFGDWIDGSLDAECRMGVGLYKHAGNDPTSSNLTLLAQTHYCQFGGTYSIPDEFTAYTIPFEAAVETPYAGRYWLAVAIGSDPPGSSSWVNMSYVAGLKFSSLTGSPTVAVPTPAKSGDPVGWNTKGGITVTVDDSIAGSYTGDFPATVNIAAIIGQAGANSNNVMPWIGLY